MLHVAVERPSIWLSDWFGRRFGARRKEDKPKTN
jgi:hypothetical protein